MENLEIAAIDRLIDAAIAGIGNLREPCLLHHRGFDVADVDERRLDADAEAFGIGIRREEIGEFRGRVEEGVFGIVGGGNNGVNEDPDYEDTETEACDHGQRILTQIFRAQTTAPKGRTPKHGVPSVKIVVEIREIYRRIGGAQKHMELDSTDVVLSVEDEEIERERGR